MFMVRDPNMSFDSVSNYLLHLAFNDNEYGDSRRLWCRFKITMLKIYSEIVTGVDSPESSSLGATKFHMLRDRCQILLQVHDELVLEVDPSVVENTAILLHTSMENAVSLLEFLKLFSWRKLSR
ncbi:unnamed protein product [Lathyrus sativus]|nr:unnamed protein product [Lathyrus sativus]